MNLQAFLKGLKREALEALAKATTRDQLLRAAKEHDVEMTKEDSEAVFAALYPVRGKSLSSEEMELVTGGAAPKPTVYTVSPKSQDKSHL